MDKSIYLVIKKISRDKKYRLGQLLTLFKMESSSTVTFLAQAKKFPLEKDLSISENEHLIRWISQLLFEI